MPLDVVNIVASEVILRNSAPPVDPATTARLSVAAGLLPGIVGLVLPIVAAREQQRGGGGGGGGGGEGSVVPNVSDGQTTLDDATKLLSANNLNVASTRAFSTVVPQNIVTHQRPQAGEARPRNSTIRLIVSDGPPPNAGGGAGGAAGGAAGATTDQLEAAKQEIEQQLTAQINTVMDRIDQLSVQVAGQGGSSPTSPP